MTKTIQNLRKLCTQHDITVKVITYSHGKHIKFISSGISSGAVNFPSDKYDILKKIKQQFVGLKINNQHVYGLGCSAERAALAAHIRCYDV